jgi:hypothetical protein
VCHRSLNQEPDRGGGEGRRVRQRGLHEGLRGLRLGFDRRGDGHERRGGDEGTTGEGRQRQHCHPPGWCRHQWPERGDGSGEASSTSQSRAARNTASVHPCGACAHLGSSVNMASPDQDQVGLALIVAATRVDCVSSIRRCRKEGSRCARMWSSTPRVASSCSPGRRSRPSPRGRRCDSPRIGEGSERCRRARSARSQGVRRDCSAMLAR